MPVALSKWREEKSWQSGVKLSRIKITKPDGNLEYDSKSHPSIMVPERSTKEFMTFFSAEEIPSNGMKGFRSVIAVEDTNSNIFEFELKSRN